MKKCRTTTKKPPFVCRYCSLSYKKLTHVSDHECLRIRTFRKEDIPEDLFSLSDLRAKKLKPKDKDTPDAYYIFWNKKRGLWNRSVAGLWRKENTKPPKPMTSKQKKSVDRLVRIRECTSRSKYQEGFKSLKEINEIQSALQKPFLVLDLETTGLSWNDEIVEISVINSTGEVLLDTLVKAGKPILSEAQDVHGISNDDLKDAPCFKGVYAKLKSILSGRQVHVFNKDFCIPKINLTCEKLGLERIAASFNCAMLSVSRLFGEYSDYHKNFQWMSLSYAVSLFEEKNGAAPTFNRFPRHRATGDCFATLFVLRGIACNAKRKIKYIETGEPTKS